MDPFSGSLHQLDHPGALHSTDANTKDVVGAFTNGQARVTVPTGRVSLSYRSTGKHPVREIEYAVAPAINLHSDPQADAVIAAGDVLPEDIPPGYTPYQWLVARENRLKRKASSMVPFQMYSDDKAQGSNVGVKT